MTHRSTRYSKPSNQIIVEREHTPTAYNQNKKNCPLTDPTSSITLPQHYPKNLNTQFIPVLSPKTTRKNCPHHNKLNEPPIAFTPPSSFEPKEPVVHLFLSKAKRKGFQNFDRAAATWLERCSALRAARRPVLPGPRCGKKTPTVGPGKVYEYDHEHYCDCYYDYD